MSSTRLAPISLALASALALGGCSLANAPILDPKGPVTLAERDLLFMAVALVLIVIIPVFALTFWFAWKYRASNGKARYAPDWSYSAPIDAVIWAVPAAIIVALGVLVWTYTHRLDPYKPLASPVAPLEVEVVAQDWKWLFIYPEQGIAVVNQLAIPVDTPVNFKITSDTVMNSFFIPGLGGQIYAMAGMETRLHLLADEPAQLTGKNTQYSGAGFSDQHFEVIAMPSSDFDVWIGKVKQSSGRLDDEAYRQLARPSSAHPVTYYSAVAENLFDRIIARYAGDQMHDHQTE